MTKSSGRSTRRARSHEMTASATTGSEKPECRWSTPHRKREHHLFIPIMSHRKPHQQNSRRRLNGSGVAAAAPSGSSALEASGADRASVGLNHVETATLAARSGTASNTFEKITLSRGTPVSRTAIIAVVFTGYGASVLAIRSPR
jgi:hypothetical protein